MSANLRAFLMLIRQCEGTADADGYRALFGHRPDAPRLFDSFADHPRIRTYEKRDEFIRNGKIDYTTAAGAYQITETTWNSLVRKLGRETLPDFSPESQDRAAVALIQGRHALDDVEAGRLESAIRKCGPEWASLPSSTSGQPRRSLEECVKFFRAAGGQIAAPAQIVPDWPFKEEAMGPFAVPAVLSLMESIPDLIRIFGKKDSESVERNAKAAETVLNMAKTVTGAHTEQEAVETLKASPEARREMSEAIKEHWFELTEASGGGIAGAAERSIKMQGDRPPFMNPALWVTAAIIPLVYTVFLVVVLGKEYSQDVKIMVIQAVIGGLLSIVSFWLGSSFGSRTKDTTRTEK